MDRRSWPWKKKSSDKTIADKAATSLETLDSANGSGSAETPRTQENYKKPSYVQISVESYTHLTGLEDHVKAYEDQVKAFEDQVKEYENQVQTRDDQIVELSEKLSAAQEEMLAKDGLVKQHAKVAEEAISGWEKAETEASKLKTELEAETLEKMTAEDRAAHLDGALKECMRQIRNLKEEHEQKLQDVIFSKTKQFEKLELEFESKMTNLDQELLRSEAENAALARSLQERSNMLIKISEQKSQAEAEIEHLKGNIESCEREINSLKYELHVAAKELEIRTEEKNMSVRSADVANKQHVEAAKKITKLEAECQRLRSLVQKKLPGPAALAQMKVEVERLGRDYGDSRRRSSGRTSSQHSPFPDFPFEELQKMQKDNEFLTDRLLAMEEETNMLKEALAKRNIELQDSRDLCGSISNKLQSLEAKVQTENKSLLKFANVHSLTSMSEDGNDYAASSSGSWSTGMNSDVSHFKQEKERSGKSETAIQLDLMDDFLEMEKLACSSNDSNGLVADSKNLSSVNSDITIRGDNCGLNAKGNGISSDAEQLPLLKLRSRICSLYESISKESDHGKVLEDIRRIVRDAHDSLHHQSASSVFEELHCLDASCDRRICPDNAGLTTDKEISPSQDSEGLLNNVRIVSHGVAEAISQIYDFVLSLGKAAEAVQDPSPDGNGLVEQVQEFSAKFDKDQYEKTILADFVADLSGILSRANDLRFNFIGFKGNEAETNGNDCIDKIALPEHKVISEELAGESYANACSDSAGSDPEAPSSGNPVPGAEVKSTSKMCSLEDFEILKVEKDNMAIDLIRCSEDLENAQSQIAEMEQQLAELKSQLDAAHRSNSLSETQLKCMVESYRSLEVRSKELEVELHLSSENAKMLEDELQKERTKHQDALARCNDLQEQLQKNSSNSESSEADSDHKNKQEKELAAAAEKLAECQETIFLLGKQLKSFRPQIEPAASPQQGRGQNIPSPVKDESIITFENMLDLDRGKMEAAASAGTVYRTGSESPMTDMYNALYIPSDSEANSYLRSPLSTKYQKHNSYASQTPEKHSRGISRFFSTKGKF